MITIIGSTHLPQLVLIHGGGVGAWMWEESVPLLSEHYQLLIVTLPYHGESTYSTIPFSINSYSQYLLLHLQQHRNDLPLGVVGFSLGAQISLELLALAPHMFTFAMINSALCTTIRIPLPLIKTIANLSLPLAKSKTFSKLQAKQLYISEVMFERYYQLSSAITAQQLTEILHTNMRYTCSPLLSNATTAIHITFGQKENSAIKKSASIIQDLLPHVTTYVVRNIGHGFPLADASAFSSYIIKHFTI